MIRIAVGATLLLAGGLAVQVSPWPAHSALVLDVSDDGIGALTLGREFSEAARLAVEEAGPSTFIGVGCGGLAEIRYRGQLGGQSVSIMAMARDGHIDSVEISWDGAGEPLSREACLERRDRFAAAFVDRFGPLESDQEVTRPVSRELLTRTGPVQIQARWFSTGGDCDVSARFGAPDVRQARR